MDQFGVLTERFGLKPQGKLAPMASSKRDFQNPQFGINLTQNPNTSQFGSSSHQNPTFDYALGLEDDIFGGNNELNVDDGGSFDYDSIFAGSVSASVDNGYVDDNGVGVGDLLDKIGEFGTGNGSDGVSDKAPEFEDLIPGFGDTSDGISSTEVNKPSTPTFTSKIPTVTSLDNGEIKQNSESKTNKINGAPNARVNESNGMDDDLEDNGSSASINKYPVMTSFDDLSLIFGGLASSEFNEVEGETEKRRQARLRHHQRTQERAARALADMNQRDLQTKMEEEDRRRIADTVDVHIMRWAAAKEGNVRALLSTLQDVLWPECGWEPVSLTDMIISTSVKKVYRKATLCIHPDKVQQKGANLEQKYTAEKVFDILKAAWNKFKIEELS